MGEFLKGEKNPKIIGIGESKTQGMRRGYIVNIENAVESFNIAKSLAEKSAGIKIKKAIVGISGITLQGEYSSGMGIVSKADGEVTSLDINKTLEDCENNINLTNKKIIKIIPLSFKLDGKEILGRPEGMRGTKLETKALFITYSLPHFEDLIEVITRAEIDPLDIVASPIAGSLISMSQKQKIVGGALVDIGAETTSIAVFENNLLTSLHTFSIGGEDITNDIALGMKVSLEDAEDLKLGNSNESFSKKKLDEIIEARLSDIFELIENHLKKMKRNELLPAGIIFIGGGANTPMLEEYSKQFLKLPSKVASTEMFGNAKTKLRDSSWFTALGLINPIDDENPYEEDIVGSFFKNFKTIIKSNLKQLMP